jgi:hypothetical protein
MIPHSLKYRFESSCRSAVAVCLAICCSVAFALHGAGGQETAPAASRSVASSSLAGSSEGGMAHMAGHMYLTKLRTRQPGDQQKADAIVEAAKTAMEPYRDYRRALADGYHIFLPNIPQPQYHFTNYENGRAASTHFDPLKPTSLLTPRRRMGATRWWARCIPIDWQRMRMS